MPAPCCLRWSGALPRPPECETPRSTRRSLGALKFLTCLFVVLWTVPKVLGEGCPSPHRGPLDGPSRALLAPQVAEAVLQKLGGPPGSPVFEAVFRVTRVFKKSKRPRGGGPRRLRKRRTLALLFRRPGERGTTPFEECHFPADLTPRRKYFLFLSGADRPLGEPLRSVFAPLPSTRRAKRRIRAIICDGCAKAPSVSRLRDDSTVRDQSANLTCTFDGSPVPSVTWLKNDKIIIPARSRNIRIHTRRVRIRPRIRRPRRRHRRGSPRSDRRRGKRRKSENKDGSNVPRRRKSRRKKIPRGRSRPVRVISTLSFRRASDSDEGMYSCVGKSVLGEASARAALSVVPPLDPGVVFPCPYDSYCLNGGTCMFFKHFGELVCQCVEGFKGQRCQEKEVFPTFRDHNCGGSLPFLTPSRGLRCPRNHPVLLWEILQQSITARRQRVSPWTKAQYLAWSPHRTPGRSLSPEARSSYGLHTTPTNLENETNSLDFFLRNLSLIPPTGSQQGGELQLSASRPIFPLSSGRVNVSAKVELENASYELTPPSIISSPVRPTSNNSGGQRFDNASRPFSLNSAKTPPISNNIPKSKSGQLKNASLFTDDEILGSKTLAPDSSHSLRQQHERKKELKIKLPTKTLDTWPLKPLFVDSNSVPRQSYVYPTS